ncbi:MAG TPA: aminotransferase [Bacilli bacterium]|nr:aminotransferase [Bacilli bacterium]
MKEVVLKVKQIKDNIILPEYQSFGSSGMDIRASEDILIMPGETKLISTGLIFEIPEGYELQVRPRSGLSLNTPLRVTNSPATIDSDYRLELGIIINNSSEKIYNVVEVGNKYILKEQEKSLYNVYDINTKGNMNGIYSIKKGDRVAQIVLAKVEKANIIKVDEIKKVNTTRSGGFGSTGTK